MFNKSGVSVAKLAVALSLALSISAVRAASPTSSDESLADSVKAALHNRFDSNGRGIRVQVVNGTIYLYGTVDTYPQRASIEDLADAAAQGHKVVDSIDFSAS
jgi:osmotically-inducible protein OsmY